MPSLSSGIIGARRIGERCRRPHATNDGACLPDDLALSAGVGETMIPAT